MTQLILTNIANVKHQGMVRARKLKSDVIQTIFPMTSHMTTTALTIHPNSMTLTARLEKDEAISAELMKKHGDPFLLFD